MILDPDLIIWFISIVSPAIGPHPNGHSRTGTASAALACKVLAKVKIAIVPATSNCVDFLFNMSLSPVMNKQL